MTTNHDWQEVEKPPKGKTLMRLIDEYAWAYAAAEGYENLSPQTAKARANYAEAKRACVIAALAALDLANQKPE